MHRFALERAPRRGWWEVEVPLAICDNCSREIQWRNQRGSSLAALTCHCGGRFRARHAGRARPNVIRFAPPRSAERVHWGAVRIGDWMHSGGYWWRVTKVYDEDIGLRCDVVSPRGEERGLHAVWAREFRRETAVGK